jgi:glycosyltransferase involved in cell wall biosynthesis
MKKVLIISYYWPPSGGSGVQRWVKFSKYLPSLGWKPIIYTPENPELLATDHSLEKEIPSEVEVIRRPILEPYGLWRKISGSKAGADKTKAEVNPINSQEKTISQKLSMFVRGNFFIPDPRFLWIIPSADFLKKYLKDHPVDLIVSTGPPHSMHLIAEKVAHATGIPWIADFRDPWTKMFYFKHLSLTKLSEKIHERLEKKVLDRANCVVAVSPLVQEEFKAMTKTNVELITNGYDEDDFDFEPQPDGNFNITHTGLFASDGNPSSLWTVLASLCKSETGFKDALRIRLCGKTDSQIIASIKDAGLGENLVDLGYCDHMTAVKEQKEASLLILPLRKEPEYKATLPGKLFEYLASERPVLGIGQTDGAMATILEETKTGMTYDWEDQSAMTRYIKLCWQLHLEGKLDVESEDIEKYSRRSTAVQMARLMDKCCRPSK